MNGGAMPMILPVSPGRGHPGFRPGLRSLQSAEMVKEGPERHQPADWRPVQDRSRAGVSSVGVS
jgi:hypothetical protein